MVQRLFSNQPQMFEFKSGNTRADILDVFKPALTERNTPERLVVMKEIQAKGAAQFGSFVARRARIPYKDRYGYDADLYGPEVVEQTGSGSYAFQNCMSAILQSFSPLALDDNQFSDLLAVMLNGCGRDSFTFFALPADYQLVTGSASQNRQANKDDFLNRWGRDLGAVEIDRTPNMYHPPSYGVMLRLSLLYNPNILKFLDCVPIAPWSHDTGTRKHFFYIPKYRVDAKLLEKPIDKMAEVVSTPEKVAAKKMAQAVKVHPMPAFMDDNQAVGTNAQRAF